MPTHIRLIAFLTCLAGTAFGQTAGDNNGPDRTLYCAAFGGGTTTDGGTLYWSLGEPATAMLLGDDGVLLAQGFWQVSALSASTKTSVEEDGPFQITCFPNPVGSELTVQWTDAARSLRAGLYDLSGRLLETALVQGGTHRFDFAARPSGTYLLRLDGEQGGHVQTFKLQKLR